MSIFQQPLSGNGLCSKLCRTSPFAIALSLLLSILYGAKHLSTDIVFTSLIHFDPGNTDHQIIWHSRIPRAAGALLIGAPL